jgi:hypothetical protein
MADSALEDLGVGVSVEQVELTRTATKASSWRFAILRASKYVKKLSERAQKNVTPPQPANPPPGRRNPPSADQPPQPSPQEKTRSLVKAAAAYSARHLGSSEIRDTAGRLYGLFAEMCSIKRRRAAVNSLDNESDVDDNLQQSNPGGRGEESSPRQNRSPTPPRLRRGRERASDVLEPSSESAPDIERIDVQPSSARLGSAPSKISSSASVALNVNKSARVNAELNSDPVAHSSLNKKKKKKKKKKQNERQDSELIDT